MAGDLDTPDNRRIDKDQLDNAEKILLLVIGSDHNKAVPGNLWIQKETFEISQEIPPLQEFFDFEPHLQGPFSETVNNIIEDLQYLGLVERNRKGIELSEAGEGVYEDVRSGSDSTIIETIERKKALLNNLSKDELLVYIYFRHPEMTTESLELDHLQEKRVSVAKKLYERNKVNLETAAQLAGEEEEGFRSQL